MFTIDPLTFIIHIPVSYLTHVSGTLYKMNTNQFRKDLKSWEDSEEGMPFPKTHDHNTEVTIVGVTYARAIKILAPYSITFENGEYSVILEGSNNNIFDIAGDILNQNHVQVIPTNSGGLISVTSGSGVTEQDKDDIVNKVWDESITGHTTNDTFGKYVTDTNIKTDEIKLKTDTINWADIDFIKSIEGGKWKIENNKMFFYDTDNTTLIAEFNLYDAAHNPTMTDVYEREKI